MFLLVRMGVLPACVSMHHSHAWCLSRPEGGFEFPGPGVTNGCEPPHGNRTWDSDAITLDEQPVVLMSGPSL